jgi:hypothetical protein
MNSRAGQRPVLFDFDGAVMRYSEEYVQHLRQGPFPGQIDPWAEDGRYFQQIHAGMIGILLEDLHLPLPARGYTAGREASLLIAGNREPDLNLWLNEPARQIQSWDYGAVAEALQVEPGLRVEMDEPELEAIYIRDSDTGELVTLVEIISPRNKISPGEMLLYTANRDALIRLRGVNVVEIDLTRSLKHLLSGSLAARYAYHIAVYLPGESARLIGVQYDEPIKSFALPLRQDALPVATQTVYDRAYHHASTASQMRREKHYSRDMLPFPSLLTEVQKQEALQTVQDWLTTLDDLRQT